MSAYFYPSRHAWRIALDGEYASWHIGVRAVLQAIRQPVRAALLEAGLPFLRQWLLNVGTLEAREGQVSLRIGFSDDGLLIVRETIQLKPRLSRTSLAIR